MYHSAQHPNFLVTFDYTNKTTKAVSTMATCPVRFDFMTDLLGKLTYVHNMPRSLVTAATSSLQDPKSIEKFVAAIGPILLEDKDICLVASDKRCQSCGMQTTQILQTPMPYLHVANGPFVNVLVNPVC